MFLGADEVGIDLGSADTLVGEHLRHCVDVRAQGDLQRGKGVAKAVERDMLADASDFYPGLEWVLNHTSAQASEHQALLLYLAAEF